MAGGCAAGKEVSRRLRGPIEQESTVNPGKSLNREPGIRNSFCFLRVRIPSSRTPRTGRADASSGGGDGSSPCVQVWAANLGDEPSPPLFLNPPWALPAQKTSRIRGVRMLSPGCSLQCTSCCPAWAASAPRADRWKRASHCPDQPTAIATPPSCPARRSEEHTSELQS